MTNVYTVLSVSFNHTKEYVYRLKRSLEKNSTTAFNFFCLTNEQLPGINTIPIQTFGNWGKIELCNPDISNEQMLYLDIDTVIIGNVDFLLNERSSFMSRGFNGQRRTQIMSLTKRQMNYVWDFWNENKDSIIPNFKGEGALYDFVVDRDVRTIHEIHPGKIIDFSEASEFISMGSKIVTFSNGDYPKNLEEDNHVKKYW